MPPETARRVRRLTVSGIQHGLTIIVMLALAAAALANWQDPMVVAVLLVLGLALALIPLSRRLPRLALPTRADTNAQPRHVTVPPRRPKPASVDADRLHQATGEMRARLRYGGAQGQTSALDTPAASKPPHTEAAATTDSQDDAA